MKEFFRPNAMNWKALQGLPASSFKCGFCSQKVSSEKGYYIGDNRDASGAMRGGIYVCPSCQGPTFFTPNGEQIPDVTFGESVNSVPDDVQLLYEEARKSTSNSCYTASVLLCRKILMHIGVEQGGEQGKSFMYYVNFLSEKGYVPPNGRHWVDHIRKKGNEANHEIVKMAREDAKDLLVFIEMLLKFIYEFPNLISKEDS